MFLQIDKEAYLRIWGDLTLPDSQIITTTKAIQWIQNLEKYQEDLWIKQKAKNEQTKPKQKEDQKSKKSKTLQTGQSLPGSLQQVQKQVSKPAKTVLDKKGKKSKGSGQQPSDPEEPQSFEVKNFLPATEQQILKFIKTYVETEQYKSFPRKSDQIQSNDKQKPKSKAAKSSKGSKKTVSSLPQSLISLCYEQAIFFYYWVRNTRQIQEKQRRKQFQQSKLKAIEQSQHHDQDIEVSQKQQSPEISRVQVPKSNKYQPKFYMELSQREMSLVNQQSYLFLKSHEPKLLIFFKHYTKIQHSLNIASNYNTFSHKPSPSSTFEQLNSKEMTLTLHQFMLFAKQFQILNAKTINEGWKVGKITRQYLMSIYYKNSLNRKQMSFEQFKRSLISISSQMFHNSDINQCHPIEMLLNFLSIKDQQRFLQKLSQYQIKYNQGDIINCFKDKSRDVFTRMNLVKVKPQLSTSVSTKLLNFRNKRMSLQQKGYQTAQNKDGLIPNNRQQAYSSETLNKQTTSRLSKSNQNRQSAPNIGFNLPRIQSNQYFSSIPHSNHLNKFQSFLAQSPGSSSVLKNKITGYTRIRQLQQADQIDKVDRKNKQNHEKLDKLIGSKLAGLFQTESSNKLNPINLSKLFNGNSPVQNYVMPNHSRIPELNELNPESLTPKLIDPEPLESNLSYPYTNHDTQLSLSQSLKLEDSGLPTYILSNSHETIDPLLEKQLEMQAKAWQKQTIKMQNQYIEQQEENY